MRVLGYPVPETLQAACDRIPGVASLIVIACRCLNKKDGSAAASVAMRHLANVDSVLTTYHSISILSTLHKAKLLPQRVGADHIERVINLFKDLSDSQGRFKPSRTSSRRSILATGLVYRALADARLLEVGLSPETEGVVEEIRASLTQVRPVNLLVHRPVDHLCVLATKLCITSLKQLSSCAYGPLRDASSDPNSAWTPSGAVFSESRHSSSPAFTIS